MRVMTTTRITVRLAAVATCGGCVFGGCQGVITAPGFRGEFDRRTLSIDTLAVDVDASRSGLLVDFATGFVDISRNAIRVEAPNVSIDLNR